MAERLKFHDAEYDADDDLLRVWFLVRGHPGAKVLAVVSAESGRLSLRRVEVEGDDLGSALLRVVANSVSDIRAGIRAPAREHAHVFGLRELWQATLTPQHERPGDRTYAEWAKRYVDAWERGVKNPIAFLADKHGTDDKQIRNYLQKARERKLLTTEGRGRVGGGLSPRAEELLARPRGKKR